MTHIRYAIKRDGVIHDATICATPEAAIMAGKVYCQNAVHDRENPDATWGKSAWQHLTQTGKVQLVELYCREIPMEMTK